MEATVWKDISQCLACVMYVSLLGLALVYFIVTAMCTILYHSICHKTSQLQKESQNG